jgi:maltooligosyltrehalose trehalohydrolase
LRALTAFILLGPGTPMLFQGQEFGSTRPFEYFAHHTGDLAAAVRKGRAEFMCQFPSMAAITKSAPADDPDALATFTVGKLDSAERERHTHALALHRDLFALRQGDPTLRAQGAHGFDGAVLGASAFVLRFFGEEDTGDRLLLVNLGADLRLVPCPEPLLASPNRVAWSVAWSSEDPRYGGDGMAEIDTPDGWMIYGESAVVLTPGKT